MVGKNRPVHLYGKLLGYCYQCRCPKCGARLNYKPIRKKGELHAKLKSNAMKTCHICNCRFNVKNNLIGERDIKTK